MIVTMRQDILPRCDRHFASTKFYRFGNPTGAGFKAYQCEVSGCTRAYNSSQGYLDIDEKLGAVADQRQQRCQKDGSPMFLHESEGGAETWRCAQIGCDYSQKFPHQPETQL
jgi:hypothetical protein